MKKTDRVLFNFYRSAILSIFVFFLIFSSGCSPQKTDDSASVPVSSPISVSSTIPSPHYLNIDEISIYSAENKNQPGKFKPAYLSELDKKKLRAMGEEIGKNPELVEPYLKRGDFYLHRFYTDEAEKDLEQAEKIFPDNPGVLLLKANLLLVKGDLKQAFEICKSVIKSHPENADAHRIIAEVLMADSQSSTAVELMNKAVELEPEDYRNYLMTAHFSVMTGRISDAISNLNKAAEKAPDESDVYVARGLFRADMKETDQALKDLDKALEIDPGLLQVYLAKGRILERTGKKQKALKVYQEILNRFRDLDSRRVKILKYKIRKLKQTTN